MDDLPPRPLTEQEKKEEFIEKMFQKEEPAVEAPDPNPGEGNATKSPPSGPFSERKSTTERSSEGAERAPEDRPSVRKELEQIRKEMEGEKGAKEKEIQKSPQHQAPKKKRKKEKTRA